MMDQFTVNFHDFLNFFHAVVVLDPVCVEEILPDKTIRASGIDDAFLVDWNIVSFRHELLVHISGGGVLDLMVLYVFSKGGMVNSS